MSDWAGCTGSCPSSPQLQLYQSMIFATPVLFVFLLLLMFCLLYFRRRSRAATIHSHIRAQIFAEGLLATVDSSADVSAVSFQPKVVQGLSMSIRQKLPIITFDEKFKSACPDTQCVVCLSDYQLSEKLQQLPVCNHLFHLPCIDEWLAKHATCPICRLSINALDLAGITDPTQSDDEGQVDATRIWEERVVHGAQTLRIWPTTLDEGSVHPLPEHDDRCVGDHMINIERS